MTFAFIRIPFSHLYLQTAQLLHLGGSSCKRESLCQWFSSFAVSFLIFSCTSCPLDHSIRKGFRP